LGVVQECEGVNAGDCALSKRLSKLVEEQTTKSYVRLAGDPAFSDVMIESLVLGGVVPR